MGPVILLAGALALPASVSLANTKAFANAYSQVKSGTQSETIGDGLRFQQTSGGVRIVDDRRVATQPTTVDDRLITARVNEALSTDIDVKARQIQTATNDGVVTLSGHVKHAHAAETAVRIALDSPGVKAVDSQLTWAKK
jgi:hypothetical protein